MLSPSYSVSRVRRHLPNSNSAPPSPAKQNPPPQPISADDFPPLGADPFAFSLLHEQSQLIIKYLQNAAHLSFQDKQRVEKKVAQLLAQPFSIEQKMARLGMLYFTLVYEKKVPCFKEDHYFLSYQDALIAQLEEYKKQHRTSPKHIQCMADGGIDFLLRSFSELIFPSSEDVNIGGIWSVLYFLKQPKLQLWIGEGHCHKMLIILQKMSVQQPWHQLMKKKITIHPDLAPFICYDLKMQNQPLPPCYYSRALVVALLSDTKQEIGESNCFSIASLTEFMESKPYQAYKSLITHLEKGYYEIEGAHIPISFLVHQSLSKHPVSALELNFSDLLSLQITQKIFAQFQINPQVLKVDNKTRKLLDLLQIVGLRAHLTPDQQKELITYFISYHRNCLQNMLFMLGEFIGTNQFGKYDHARKRLMDSLLSHCKQDLSITAQEIQEIEKTWKQELFVIPIELFPDIRLIISSFDLNHTCYMLRNVRDLDEAHACLSEVMAPYLLEGNRMIPLYEVAACNQYLLSVVKQYAKNANQSLDFKPCLRTFMEADFIQEHKRYAGQLFAQGCFLLKEHGGFIELIGEKFLGIEYQEKALNCQTLTAYTESFRQRLIPLKNQQSMVMWYPGHLHTFHTKSFTVFWDYNRGMYSQLKEKTFSRAQTLLQQPAEASIKDELFQKIFLTKYLRNRKRDLFDQNHSTLLDLRIFLLSNVSAKQKSEVKKYFHKATANILIQNIPFDELCKRLTINIDDKVIVKLKQIMMDKVGDVRATPFLIAKKLKRLLLIHGHSGHSTHELERAICDLMGYPLPFYIGETNYRVNHSFTRSTIESYVIYYHFGKNQLIQGRTGLTEFVEDGTSFTAASIRPVK